jgi:hypothetical protein
MFCGGRIHESLPDPESSDGDLTRRVNTGLPNGSGTVTRLWNDVQAAFQTRLSRGEFMTWIRCASLLSVERGVATIGVPNALVKEAIEGKYRVPLRNLLTMHIGEAVTLQVILNGAHDADPAVPPVRNQVSIAPDAQNVPPNSDSAPNRRPDWIRVEHWEALPAMLRAALIGSTLEDGQMHAASPYLGRLLHGRYAEAVAALLAG